MREYIITLKFKYDETEYDSPLDWDWGVLLDMDNDDIEIVSGDYVRPRSPMIVKEADPELERLLREEELISKAPVMRKNLYGDKIPGAKRIISSGERDRPGWAQERLTELRSKRSKGPKKRKRG